MSEFHKSDREGTVEDQINSGLRSPEFFQPEDKDGSDSYTSMFLIGQGRRGSIGEPTKRGWGENRRDSSYIRMPGDPNFVVKAELKGWNSVWDGEPTVVPAWEYDPKGSLIRIWSPNRAESKRRVFRVEGQRMQLDINATLSHMGANLADKDEVIALIRGLERENDFDNYSNQVVLQDMYRRVESGGRMIPGEINIPYGGPNRDPYKMNLITPKHFDSWIRHEEGKTSS